MNKAVDIGKSILKTLTENQFQAFFVGGFVRDLILGLKTEDIDICTDATPEAVKALFPKVRDTGEKYGTVTVLIDQVPFEVTTFRRESDYQDARHPGKVAFESELDQDLRRRDFTINAMAMTFSGEIIDRHSGRQDLEKRLIRAIGNPEERFKEDALRILRAFRFLSKLNFQLEDKTSDAIQKAMPLLAKVANERIRTELTKIRRYPFRAKAYQFMLELGIDQVFPELVPGLAFLSRRVDPLLLDEGEFYSLCFYLAKTDIPDKWRFSRIEKRRIQAILAFLEEAHKAPLDWKIVYRNSLAVSRSGEKLLHALEPDLYEVDQIERIWGALPIKELSDLALRGDDLKDLYPRNDQAIGEALNLAVELVNTHQLPNDKHALLDYLEHQTKR